MQKLFIFALLLFFIGCSVSEDQEKSSVSVVTLKCENVISPINIDQLHPRLSWIMQSEEKGQCQTAYQILVASSPDLLSEKEADIWNSGKINSSASVLVPYEGSRLESGQRYYYTVKIWDKDGKQSDYAEPSFLEMAILNCDGWKGEWISAPRVFDFNKRDSLIKVVEKDAMIPPDPMPLFRKPFTVDKKVKSAKIYISGLGFYELYLNGDKVGDHILAPAFTDYSKTVYYEAFDLSSELAEGENVLGVILGNGWYNQVSTDVWSFSKAPWIADPALICQLELEYEDGSTQRIVSDKTWRCTPGPIIFSDFRLGETYDANKEIKDWCQPGVNEKNWQEVRVVNGPEGSLKVQNMPPVRVMKELSPEKIIAIGKMKYIVDFGQNMAGFIKLKGSGNKGDKVTFRYAEKLNKKGELDQSNIANLVSDSRFQTDEYVFKGEGVEEWNPRFNYHGFRYVEVTGWEGELKKENLTACFIHNDFLSTSQFKCSIPLLNQIQGNTLWSFGSNFVNIPTDCPQREKNGWTGDAQLASEAGLFNYNMLLSYEKWVNDILDAQRSDGMIPGIVPTGGWGFYWGNGPAWDYALFEVPWNLYLYEGDSKILADVYPAMKKYLELLATIEEDGIVDWGLGDWCPARTRTPAVLTSTAYYFKDLSIASDIAGMLGFSEDHSNYKNLASKVKVAFNKKFFNDKGEFVYTTQTGLGCALYMQIADSSKVEYLTNQLVKNITSNDYNLDFGILGSKYVPNALSQFGHKDIAYGMINTTEYPGWGNWIVQGATTLWEDWDGRSSLNHIMFGDVSAWFYKNLAGIMPDITKPGFKHFYVDPYFPSDLDWVECVKNTSYGDIKVDWSKSGSEIKINLEIPVNTSASVVLPSGKLLIDGENFKEGSNGVLKIYKKDNLNNLELGSGIYDMTLMTD